LIEPYETCGCKIPDELRKLREATETQTEERN